MSSFDFFISHAQADRERYVDALVASLRAKGMECWLDTAEIGWGDNLALKLSEGLQRSKFVLLCLSGNFLRRPWPETELGAALAIQNSESRRRVLPLILDSRKEVLSHYPILAGFAYREFSSGVDSLVEELVAAASPSAKNAALLRVRAESTYTPKECESLVEPRATVKWLSDKLQTGLGVSARAETGAHMPFMVRWVPVDVRAEKHWLEMSRAGRRRLYAIVMSEGGMRLSYSSRDRLEDLGVYDGILFHLYSVEDEDYDALPESAAKTGF